MKRTTIVLTALVLLALLASTAAASPTAMSGAPSFAVVSVIPDGYVTVRVYNFPANTDVKALMGPYGTLGIGGAQMGGFTTSGVTADYMIEMAGIVKGQARGAIRLEAPAQGIYLSANFENVPGGSTTPTATATPPASSSGGTSGSVIVPLIDIVSVQSNVSVTVHTSNFPANDTYNVLMNYYGTLGIGGTVVATVNSGSSGSGDYTFNIPDFLKGQNLIAIRMESPTTGYYSYNWFTNQTGGTSSGPVAPPPAPVAPPAASFVVPTFSITAVVRDSSVTVVTSNFPSGDTFDVYMNVFGTLGIGGVKVATVSSGSGGSLTYTFNIPDSLKGLDRIAIRFQSPGSGYFSYNWFWNSTY